MKMVVFVSINSVVGKKQSFVRASGPVGTKWIINVKDLRLTGGRPAWRRRGSIDRSIHPSINNIILEN